MRPYGETDRPWAEGLLEEAFGGRLQMRHGELLDVLALPGFVAERVGAPVGLLTYRRDADECELAFVYAREPGQGIGTALVRALLQEVAGCARIWTVTTNDKLDALRFYQCRGFTLSALRPGAVTAARRELKPQIPAVGAFRIPLRDELELELLLTDERARPVKGDQLRSVRRPAVERTSCVHRSAGRDR